MDEIRKSDCSSMIPCREIRSKEVEAEPIVVEVDRGSSELVSSLRGFVFLGQTRCAYLLTYIGMHTSLEKNNLHARVSLYLYA